MPDHPVSDFTTLANASFRSRPSFGFICWNSTEVGRILEIARSLENGCIVIGRPNGWRKGRRFGAVGRNFKFEETVFTDAGVPVVVWPKERMRKFDGFFDVIVCQVPFDGIDRIKDSRVVILPEDGDCRASVEAAMNPICRE